MNRGFLGLGMAPKRVWRAICAALACAVLTLAPPALAGETASASGTTTAVVVAPLSLIKTQDLRFGRIAPRATAGTVTVNPDTGACTITGPILHIGTCGFAEFTGMGRRNMTVRIQIPTSVTLTGPGGASMLADTMTLGTSPDITFIGGNGNGLGSGNRRYRIEPTSGIFSMRVAGRLNIGANQAPGLYTGTFSVTVQYQ